MDRVLNLIFITTVMRTYSNNVDETTYSGQHFPTKYLVPEEIEPSVEDLEFYLRNMVKIINYFWNEPNDTNINNGAGFYFSNAILKRTLRDYGEEMSAKHYTWVKHLIWRSDYLLSHYVHLHKHKGWRDTEYRMAKIFKNDEPLVATMKDFNQNKLKNWILDNVTINNFTREMDSGSLSRTDYIRLVETGSSYHITIPASDTCISRVVYNPDPVHAWEMKPCKEDSYCQQAIVATPSVAYGLSHRMVNNLLYYHVRRCYLYSEFTDPAHMEMLCSFMYREAVYLARKGYFARDMFIEHVALCAMLGYKEFHRRHWFHKAASWVTPEGCIPENRNFDIKKSQVLISRTNDTEKIARHKRILKRALEKHCNDHATAVGLIFFAHGVRYAVHNIVSSMFEDQIKLGNDEDDFETEQITA